jgi:hypothetical protein
VTAINIININNTLMKEREETSLEFPLPLHVLLAPSRTQKHARHWLRISPPIRKERNKQRSAMQTGGGWWWLSHRVKSGDLGEKQSYEVPGQRWPSATCVACAAPTPSTSCGTPSSRAKGAPGNTRSKSPSVSHCRLVLHFHFHSPD